MTSCVRDSPGLLLTVAARSSNLSRAQVAEVLQEIHAIFPNTQFVPVWITTTGDLDLFTPLRLLDKTDFFTREVDQMLLQNKCRIAIHSAKDLPEPLPDGLKLVAITKGVDAADVLVFPKGRGMHDLPPLPRIGVSCMRREQTVKKIVQGAKCCDIRGTIERRLALLEKGEFDAVVMAEAALIRLGLTDLGRFRLDGPTSPMQGRLAVIARKGDREMEDFFQCVDTRVRSKGQSPLPKGRGLKGN